MRSQKIILTFLTVVFFSCSKKNGEIIINGKIEGNLLAKVQYTTPIDGNWFYGNKKSIMPDTTGSFQIKMPVSEPSFITLYIPRKASAILLVEPGENYNINFELEEKEKKFVVTSEGSQGQNLYNSFPPPEFHIFNIRNFLNDSIPSKISSQINILRKKEISEFNSLLEKGEISEDFYKLAVLDRKTYYLALEARIAKMLLERYLEKANTAGKTQVKDFWDKKIDLSLINESDYIRSPWFYALAYNFMGFNQYTSGNLSMEKLNKIYEAGNIHHYDVDVAKEYLSGKGLEYYFASYIHYNCRGSKDNSRELIEIYENFKNEYPDSDYTQYLTTSVKPIIDYHNKIAEALSNEEIKFVENYESIGTFKELIQTLNGKKVFVDIWGTWCGPCKVEFKHKDKLNELLKSKNITALYICEGKYSKEKIWKEMIKFYELEGRHIRANENLVADIVDKFENNGSFAYPRYLLVDENGSVVNEQASYPSNIKELEKEINENYVW